MNTLLICAFAIIAIALISEETEAKPNVPLGGALQARGSRFGSLTPGCDKKEEEAGGKGGKEAEAGGKEGAKVAAAKMEEAKEKEEKKG